MITVKKNKHQQPETFKEMFIMKIHKYIFADGYFCYICGKLDRIELKHEIIKHGKVISMTVEG
jgi:hypothetical protein